MYLKKDVNMTLTYESLCGEEKCENIFNQTEKIISEIMLRIEKLNELNKMKKDNNELDENSGELLWINGNLNS